MHKFTLGGRDSRGAIGLCLAATGSLLCSACDSSVGGAGGSPSIFNDPKALSEANISAAINKKLEEEACEFSTKLIPKVSPVTMTLIAGGDRADLNSYEPWRFWAYHAGPLGDFALSPNDVYNGQLVSSSNEDYFNEDDLKRLVSLGIVEFSIKNETFQAMSESYYRPARAVALADMSVPADTVDNIRAGQKEDRGRTLWGMFFCTKPATVEKVLEFTEPGNSSVQRTMVKYQWSIKNLDESDQRILNYKGRYNRDAGMSSGTGEAALYLTNNGWVYQD